MSARRRSGLVSTLGLQAAQLVSWARRARGLSLAALAERSGLGRSTLQELEAGREARCSSLQACLDSLGTLAPSRLFPGTAGRLPPVLPEAWLFHASAFDLVVRQATRTVQVDRTGRVHAILDLKGIRSTGSDLRDADARAHVHRAIVRAPGDVLRQLVPRAAAVRDGCEVIEHGNARHEFRCPPQPNRQGLDYRCEEEWTLSEDEDLIGLAASLATGCHLALSEPARQLTLGLRLPADRADSLAPAVWCWPATLVPRGGSRPFELGARIRSRSEGPDRVLEVTLRRPLVGLEHALVLGRRDDERCSPAVPTAPNLGAGLEAARAAAGLSLRALARAAGASAMTVSGAERGRDLRAGTLARCLDALPDLSPWSLFVRPDATSDPPRLERAWDYYRDLFGCETEEESKQLRLSSRGNASLQILTQGLRRLRATRESFHLRLGRSRPVLLRSHAELDAIEMDESLAAGLHVRGVTSPFGEQQHELIVPADAAATGVTFARRFRHPGVFTMTERRARKRTGLKGPFREGTSFGVLVPTRCLRIVVDFPKGHWPLDVRAAAWSAAETPSSTRADSSARLHPEGLELSEDPARGRLTLTVHHALPTVKYSLGWQLP